MSPASLDRALKIMDELIKKLESKSFDVSLTKQGYKNATSANVSGMTFAIDLYEKINIIKKGVNKHGWNDYEYLPNGKLVLRIKNAPSGARSEWIDRDNKKLEKRIDSFVEGLHKCVVREEELRLERLKWQEEYRKKEEEQDAVRLEQERFAALEKNAVSWHRSKTIRSYIEAAAQVYIEKHGAIEPGSEFDKWREWANRQVDRFDPLVENAK